VVGQTTQRSMIRRKKVPVCSGSLQHDHTKPCELLMLCPCSLFYFYTKKHVESPQTHCFEDFITTTEIHELIFCRLSRPIPLILLQTAPNPIPSDACFGDLNEVVIQSGLPIKAIDQDHTQSGHWPTDQSSRNETDGG
jgi:hypothetical protein